MKKLSKSDFAGPTAFEMDDACRKRAAIDEALYWALRIKLQRMYRPAP